MNLSHVEIIVEIAKAGSISQAAQNLYISQPGVSKILKKFEEEVGAQIFERVNSGVRLTPLGRRFVERAQYIIEQADKLDEFFRESSAAAGMEFSVASMSYHFMRQMLSELYNKYSNSSIHIRYTECATEDLMELVTKGEAEIGIISHQKNHAKQVIRKCQTKGLEYHRLGGVDTYLGVSADSRNYPPEIGEFSLKHLANMPMVTISPSPIASKAAGWDSVAELFGQKRSEMHYNELITNSTGTMRALVRKIDGFSIIHLNRGVRERYGFFEDIRLIPINSPVEFEMGWIQRANTVRSPLANEFITNLAEYTFED